MYLCMYVYIYVYMYIYRWCVHLKSARRPSFPQRIAGEDSHVTPARILPFVREWFRQCWGFGMDKDAFFMSSGMNKRGVSRAARI